MRNVVRPAITTLVFNVGFVLIGGTAFGRDISGTISSTLTITEDSQLVGDVTCTVQGAPCIAIGASGIKLKLNGFTMTGLADAATGCRGGGQPGATAPEDGISIINRRGVIIEGPGVVQQFRTQGIRIASSTRVLVTKVTASTNCGSGLFVSAGSDNELEANISVRNGHTGFPCGGIWLAGGTSRNRVRGNRTSGNGYIDQPGIPADDFGIGIISPGSNDNVIIDNIVVGNANGIMLVAGVQGNFIRRNLVVGNPPVQVSVSFPATTGVDIRNLAAPGANTIEDNVCLTGVNAVCPSVEDTLPNLR